MTRTETITATTGIKTTLGTLVAVGAAVISAGSWCTCMYLDVQLLKKNDEEKTKAIAALTDKLAGIDTDVKHIRWILDPTASKPVLMSSSHNTSTNPTTATP